jgi:hypothetical protein
MKIKNNDKNLDAFERFFKEQGMSDEKAMIKAIIFIIRNS